MTLRLCRVFIDLLRPVRPDHLMFLIDYMNIYWTFWILLLRDFVTKFQENFKKYFLRMFFFFFFFSWENFSFVRLNFFYRWPIFEVWSKLFSHLSSELENWWVKINFFICENIKGKKEVFFPDFKKKKRSGELFCQDFCFVGRIFSCVKHTNTIFFYSRIFLFFF